MRSASISLQLVIEVAGGPSPTTPGFKFDTLLPGLLAAIFVAIGWIVVERFARARERRADMRELAKMFASTVDDVTDTAHEFYQLDGGHPRAQALAAVLRAKLSALPRLIQAIREVGFPVETADQMKQFRQSVTGGEFDKPTRAASPADAPIYPEITAAGRSLAAEVQIALIRTMSRPTRQAKVLPLTARRPGKLKRRG